ncbi:protein charlatan [Contarinia nasturtii]|uniref:protein charlatan n=1 Tax=Contarinia nasturtii TaxID=265458 RepID=UPI0012D39024|nr:protein charlatan [Contarinia nasturtii]
MTSTLITNSQASGVEAYEDMFKEITRKLYGEESSQNVQTPVNITPTTPVLDAERSFSNLLSDRTSTGEYEHGVGVENAGPLKSDDHLTAFGLALMQNGFPTPNAILNSHTFHQINKQNQTNPSASNTLNSFSSNLNSVQGQSNTSNELNLQKTTQHGNELNAWISSTKCESYQNAHQKQFKSKKQDIMMTSSQHLINEPLKSTNDMNGNTAQSGQTLQKRYNCTNCTYSSDRRDLFTRHENIHKDDKPFHCYVCLKQFNRADHVKKHFLRMHRGLNYDICRTKRSLPQQKSKKSNSSGAGYNNTSDMINISSNFHATLQNSNVEQPSQASIIDQTNQHLSNTFHGGGTTSTSNHQNQSQQLNVKVEKNTEKPTIVDKRFMCCYCSWSGNDNWGLKRHLNTHTKPFVCVLCDYKAARSERLATHVLKVHNKKICTKCNFLAENQNDYNNHVNDAHANDTRSHRNSQVTNTSDTRSPANNILRNTNNSFGESNSFNAMQSGSSNQSINNWRLMNNTGPPDIAKTNGNSNSNQKRGAERLFQYFEAGDSDPEEDYARQLQMAAISRNTAAVAQDFHNAGGGNQTFPMCELHIYDKNSKQQSVNEFLSSNNIKIDAHTTDVMFNQESLIEQYFTISPPAKQFDENEKENTPFSITMPYKVPSNVYYSLDMDARKF